MYSIMAEKVYKKFKFTGHFLEQFYRVQFTGIYFQMKKWR